MARVKNTMQLIKKSTGKINAQYDICAENINDIHESNNDIFSMICDGFRFGYMQGMKATRAEIKKGGSCI